jgi:mannosylglycerate hydrolase
VPQPTVYLVPHTHWDREWYLPFQRFRVRLVELIDRVLDTMERDERFVFTLDGQLATVDDYLEVRPDAEPRIADFVRAGRLAIGPWQILMDEFLVSGETIVRNLEAGLRRGEELGGAMAIGYLPDMFGHVAQMPQILRRAGIEHAVVWRGVPAAIATHAFEWAAPDGSSSPAATATPPTCSTCPARSRRRRGSCTRRLRHSSARTAAWRCSAPTTWCRRPSSHRL